MVRIQVNVSDHYLGDVTLDNGSKSDLGTTIGMNYEDELASELDKTVKRVKDAYGIKPVDSDGWTKALGEAALYLMSRGYGPGTTTPEVFGAAVLERIGDPDKTVDYLVPPRAIRDSPQA